MNKNLFSAFFLAILLGFSQTATSCWDGIKGNGKVVKSDRMLSGFESISVSTGLDLYITQDSIEKVVVEADENLQEIIIAEVRNGELKLHADKSIYHASAKKVHVTIKNIRSLSASAGADAQSTSKLIAEELSVSASSGADVKLELNCKTVSGDASSGSDMKLKGTSQEIKANCSSGAGLNASDLVCESGEADVSSGADIAIHVTGKVKADASSGGNVTIYGNPKERDASTSSGGDVNYR
jgi:hypothetical protein